MLSFSCFAACSNGEGTSPQAQGPTTTAVKARTAREFIEGFKQRKLPVGMVVCYNDENDPNNLLGRPGGYIEKCDWADKREKQDAAKYDYNDPDSGFDLIGGSIETYEEPSGAASRAEELRAFEGGILSTGYTFTPKDDVWVLRVDKELTKAQAQAYLDAFLAQL